jgi:hypothetical protein
MKPGDRIRVNGKFVGTVVRTNPSVHVVVSLLDDLTSSPALSNHGCTPTEVAAATKAGLTLENKPIYTYTFEERIVQVIDHKTPPGTRVSWEERGSILHGTIIRCDPFDMSGAVVVIDDEECHIPPFSYCRGLQNPDNISIAIGLGIDPETCYFTCPPISVLKPLPDERPMPTPKPEQILTKPIKPGNRVRVNRNPPYTGTVIRCTDYKGRTDYKGQCLVIKPDDEQFADRWNPLSHDLDAAEALNIPLENRSHQVIYVWHTEVEPIIEDEQPSQDPSTVRAPVGPTVIPTPPELLAIYEKHMKTGQTSEAAEPLVSDDASAWEISLTILLNEAKKHISREELEAIVAKAMGPKEEKSVKVETTGGELVWDGQNWMAKEVARKKATQEPTWLGEQLCSGDFILSEMNGTQYKGIVIAMRGLEGEGRYNYCLIKTQTHTGMTLMGEPAKWAKALGFTPSDPCYAWLPHGIKGKIIGHLTSSQSLAQLEDDPVDTAKEPEPQSSTLGTFLIGAATLLGGMIGAASKQEPSVRVADQPSEVATEPVEESVEQVLTT